MLLIAKVLNTGLCINEKIEDLDTECEHLQFPSFVKPAKAGDSLGIDEQSLVKNKTELKEKVRSTLNEYSPLLIEEYINGREFTVMLSANPEDEKDPVVFKPVEYIFSEGNKFKTYALKTSELHPYANIPVTDLILEKELKAAAKKIFNGFNGVGYARLDFRMNEKGELYF
ncbi:MAG: hypothetical protein WDM71_11795 [Ferruginibacter sp.]